MQLSELSSLSGSMPGRPDGGPPDDDDAGGGGGGGTAAAAAADELGALSDQQQQQPEEAYKEPQPERSFLSSRRMLRPVSAPRSQTSGAMKVAQIAPSLSIELSREVHKDPCCAFRK